MTTEVFLVVALQKKFTVILVAVAPVVSVIESAAILPLVLAAGEVATARDRGRQPMVVFTDLDGAHLSRGDQVPNEVTNLLVTTIVP